MWRRPGRHDTHKQKIKRDVLFHTVDFSAYDASVWALQLDESFPNDPKTTQISRNRVFNNPASLLNNLQFILLQSNLPQQLQGSSTKTFI
jgi:hypothetical protein